MRILVCGGRDYGNPRTLGGMAEYRTIGTTLNAITERFSRHYNPNDSWLPADIVIIHGGAPGADTAAGDYAAVHFCQEQCFPADWTLHGKAAGYIRNRQMLVEGKPDLVVAFPGGKGTQMMKDLATKAGIKVIDMTMVYNITDLQIMLNQAILVGDKHAEVACKQALVDEYEETIRGQEIVDELKP